MDLDQSGINLAVHPGSRVPIYAQVMEQLRMAVGTGKLRRGDKLPSIRGLANQLGVNPNTIAKAYMELEREGLVQSGQGRGTFVSSEPPSSVPPELGQAFDKVVALGLGAGIEAEELHQHLDHALERLKALRAIKGGK